MPFSVPRLTRDDIMVLEAIDQLRNDLRLNLARPRRWHGALRRQTKARSVRGSNSIEGIDVTDSEAMAIVAGEEEQVTVDKTWLAIKGYSDAMTYARAVATDAKISIDESLIRSLHFMVQGYDLDRRPGQYRLGDIHVLEEDTGRAVYTGPDAGAVPDLMTRMVEDLHTWQEDGVPALVQGAMAHLDLVMIHPFADGNGRLSRILQSLVLYRGGIEEAEFVSVEEYLGHNTQAYYGVLASVGQGRWNPGRDAAEWIEFILIAHFRQARTVQRRIWRLSRVAEQVDELIESLDLPVRAAPALELSFSGWHLRNATYRDLAQVRPNVASRDLNALVDAGVLQRHGAKRGTWYSAAPAHRASIEELHAASAELFPAGIDPYRSLRRGDDLAVVPISSVP